MQLSRPFPDVYGSGNRCGGVEGARTSAGGKEAYASHRFFVPLPAGKGKKHEASRLPMSVVTPHQRNDLRKTDFFTIGRAKKKESEGTFTRPRKHIAPWRRGHLVYFTSEEKTRETSVPGEPGVSGPHVADPENHDCGQKKETDP